MSSATLLAHYLSIQADLNYYTMQQIFWSGKYEANSKKLDKQVKLEEKWNSAVDSAMNNTKEMTVMSGGQKIIIAENNTNQALAERYAKAKVKQYDEALSTELAELDVEYDTQKSMYEALQTELQAEKDAAKQATATAMQDNKLLQS